MQYTAPAKEILYYLKLFVHLYWIVPEVKHGVSPGVRVLDLHVQVRQGGPERNILRYRHPETILCNHNDHFKDRAKKFYSKKIWINFHF